MRYNAEEPRRGLSSYFTAHVRTFRKTMLKHYKEIIYGLLLGLAMWVIDAAMHVQLAADNHSSNIFLDELLRPGATQLLFRSVFLIIATLFGWALWRSNWRERELHALENAIVAFHRQLDSPAMRITNHARMLHGRPGVMHDEIARELTESIGDDARMIDELALAYMRFSEQVRAGQTSEAIETLRRIETWASKEHSSASFAAPDGSSST